MEKMKYLRTKHWVWTREQYEQDYDSCILDSFGNKCFENEMKIIAQSDNILDLIDEVIQISLGTSGKPQLVAKWLWEDDADFDPEQEEMYGAIWVAGDIDEPMLKPVIKKTEIGKWEFI